MEIELQVILRVRDGRLHDLSGLIAQLWDEDLASDDLLSEGVVSVQGGLFRTLFRFDPKKVSSADSLGEKRPDLYVVVNNGEGGQVFKSAILGNVDLKVSASPAVPVRLEFVEA